MKVVETVLLFICMFFASCEHGLEVKEGVLAGPVVGAAVAKWYNGHSSAVSLTFDIPVTTCHDAVDEVANRGLTVSVEMATWYFTSKNKEYFRRIEYYRARGIKFFGHGHEHLYFDTLSYDDAYTQFDSCYTLMEKWNFPKPFSYSYPFGAGYTAHVQRACEAAGFICSRAIGYDPNVKGPELGKIDRKSLFICPGDVKMPKNWFCLPAVCVAQNVPGWTNSNQDMKSLLRENIEKKAWLLLMYHSIGLKNEVTYYPMNEFIKDLDFLVEEDIWVESMDVITRYVQERNCTNLIYDVVVDSEDSCVVEVTISDTVSRAYERVPLTVELQLNPARKFDSCTIVSEGESVSSNQLIDNYCNVTALPDGKKYVVHLYREKGAGQ